MRIVRLPNVNLRVVQLPRRPRDDREREDLVLLHGLASNLGLWYFRIAHRLAARYRVTLFDLPGHGRSSMKPRGYRPADIAGDLGDLLDALEIERAHLVGHSYGGAVSLEFASRAPERVRSVTLMDTRLRAVQLRQRLRDWPSWREYLALLRQYDVRVDEQSTEFGLDVLEAMAQLRLRDPQVSYRLHRILPVSLLSRGGLHGAQQWLVLMNRPEVKADLQAGDALSRRDLRSLRLPTLAIYGQASPAVRTGRVLRRIWPHASVEILPGEGHYFVSAHPDWVAQRLLEFLAEHAGRETGEEGTGSWVGPLRPETAIPAEADDAGGVEVARVGRRVRMASRG